MYHREPKEYPVSSYCTECGNDFSGDRMFDRHRVGTFDYTYSEGLQLDPSKEDGRRCLTIDEMKEKGWRPFTDEELKQSRRNSKRAGFGVNLWFDPAEIERTKENLQRLKELAKSS